MEEQSQDCFFCKDNFATLTPFSCTHQICPRCIIQRIFCYQIEELNQVNQMPMKCKCSQGSLSLNLQQVNDLFVNYRKENSAKQGIIKCKKHQRDKDHYCLDCYHVICPQCHTEEAEVNKTHQIEDKKSLSQRIKKFIPNLSMSIQSPEAFLLAFNETSSQLEDEVKLKFKSTMQNIESLIKSLQSFYKNYQEIYIKSIERGVLNLKLIKLFYLQYYFDLKQADNCDDINTLRYLNNISHVFDRINTFHNEEIDLKVNEMKAKIEDLKKITEPIKIEFKYKEVSREYKCTNIISKVHSKGIGSIIQLSNEMLLTGGKDNLIKLWKNDGNDYKESSIIKGLTGEVNDLIEIDTRRIMGAEENSGTLKIWVKRNDSYEVKHSLSYHNSSVTSLVKLSDGRILSGSKDKTISIIKVMKENEEDEGNLFQKVGSINQIDGTITGLIPLQDKKLGVKTMSKLMCFKEISENNFVSDKVYDIASQSIKSVCQLKDKKIVIGSSSGKIFILEDDWFIVSQTLMKHKGDVQALIQLRNDHLASASIDHSIIIWGLDKDTKYQVHQSIVDYYHGLFSLIELKDGQLCASCSFNNLIFWRSRNDHY